jgi:hypothetical protein
MECPNCHADVPYNVANCRSCNHPVGYPNVRRAEAMRADLDVHYTAALADAAARNVADQLDRLEQIAAHSLPTITTDTKCVVSLAMGANYLNYYESMDQGRRQIAEARYHSHRAAVDEKIHPGYGQWIINAALSPDGRGLSSYGAVTLALKEAAVAQRASVLRENAYDFYDACDLGRRDAEEPPGWRSTWDERQRLAIAHLGQRVTVVTTEADLPALLLSPGTDKQSDRFLEVHIWGFFDSQALAQVRLDNVLTKMEDQENWEFARQKLTRAGIMVTERTAP